MAGAAQRVLDLADAQRAEVEHAGGQHRVRSGVDRGRVGVVIGNIALPTETSSALARETLGRTFEEGLGIVAAALGIALGSAIR